MSQSFSLFLFFSLLLLLILLWVFLYSCCPSAHADLNLFPLLYLFFFLHFNRPFCFTDENNSHYKSSEINRKHSSMALEGRIHGSLVSFNHKKNTHTILKVCAHDDHKKFRKASTVLDQKLNQSNTIKNCTLYIHIKLSTFFPKTKKKHDSQGFNF